MFSKIICYFRGHMDFNYVSHSDFPDEHAVWCGRCGRETSWEREWAQELAGKAYFIRYAERRSQYY